MRLALLVALLAFASLSDAQAEPIALAVNGAWTTQEDLTSQTKMCGIQIAVNGGQFSVFGTSDQQGVLRVGLRKSSWHIVGVIVPIVIKFADDATFTFSGYGSGPTIYANVPATKVRLFIHHLTADDEATLTLPEGHEAPWRMDLHGTTPATLSLGQCVDATQINLPPPFRAPHPLETQTTSTVAPSDAGTSPSTVRTLSPSQSTSPDQAAAIGAPADNGRMDTGTQSDEGSRAVAQQEHLPEDSNGDKPLSQASTAVESRSNDAGGLLAMGGIFIALAIAGSIAFYFIPFLIGSSRKIENRSLLFITNLLFGWTVLGWFGCLLWAALAQNGIDRALYRKMLREVR